MTGKKKGVSWHVIVGACIATALVAGGVLGLRAWSRIANAEMESLAHLQVEIQEFRDSVAGLEPSVAVERWFRLFARAGDGGEGFGESNADQILASLPPPSAWPAFREEATRRAAAAPGESKWLALRFLGEVLTRDIPAATATLPALEHAGVQSDVVNGARSLLARLYGDVDAQVAALRQELRVAGPESEIELPHLGAMVGEERAIAVLHEALRTRATLKVQGGPPARALARRVALGNLDEIAVAQWGLAADLDGDALYEALEKKFGESAGADETRREATTYYFLRMVRDGRQADAERALERITDAHVSIPKAAVDALTRAQMNEALYRFLGARLARKPQTPAWDLYLEQAAFTGHAAEALALLESQLERNDLGAAVRSELRGHRVDALLAADRVTPAVEEYLEMLRVPPAAAGEGLSTRVDLAAKAASVGRLVGRKDLADAGIRLATETLLLPQPGQPDFRLQLSGQRLFKEMRRAERTSELEALLDRMAGEPLSETPADPEAEMRAYMRSINAQAALIELVSVRVSTGRAGDALKLLAEKRPWGADDVYEIVPRSDSLGRPFGAIVAQALRDSGDAAAALRLARATVAAAPGHDAAYEIVAALDPAAGTAFDTRFGFDRYEERPLIWKASVLLAAGQVAEAEKTIRDAIAIDPSDGEEGPNDRMRAYAVLAEILDRRKDPQAQLYRNAVQAIRLSEQTDQLYEAGLYTRAFAGYRAALEKFSDAYCVQSRLAVQLSKQGRHAQAVEHYRRAYELMPDSFGRVESHCFGCESVFQGAAAQSIAEQVFGDAIRRTPGKAQAHYLLAYLRQQQGRPAEALQPLRAAVSIDPLYLNAWKLLDELGEQTYLEAAERDIARLKLLELDPLRRHVYPELDEVGRLDELWKAAAKAAELGGAARLAAGPLYPLGSAPESGAAQPLTPEAAEEMRMMAAFSDGSNWHTPSMTLHQHVIVGVVGKMLGVERPWER